LMSKKGSIHNQIHDRLQQLNDGEESGRDSRAISRASSGLSPRGMSRTSGPGEVDIEEKDEHDGREGDSSGGEENEADLLG